MDWTDLNTQIGVYAQQEAPSSSFAAAIPRMVDNAELRIYRELDFAAASGQNKSLQTVALSKVVNLTTMTGQTVAGLPVAFQYPVVVEAIAARVQNRWVPFQLVSLEFLDLVWPDETITAAPRDGRAYYTMMDNQTALLAPVPDAVYPLRVTGSWRPAPMSATNTHSWLGDNLPDLLFCAVMVEVMGFQRDFGAQSDDPQAAMSWERRYQEAKRTALDEEARRKGLGPGYQPYAPAPLAAPQGA